MKKNSGLEALRQHRRATLRRWKVANDKRIAEMRAAYDATPKEERDRIYDAQDMLERKCARAYTFW